MQFAATRRKWKNARKAPWLLVEMANSPQISEVGACCHKILWFREGATPPVVVGCFGGRATAEGAVAQVAELEKMMGLAELVQFTPAVTA